MPRRIQFQVRASLNMGGEPLRARFRSNLAILVGGEVLSRGLTFLAFMRLARLLSLSGYGLLELAQAAMVFMTMGADLGTGKTGTREIAASGGTAQPDLVRAVLSVRLVLVSLIVAVLGVFGSCLPIEPALRRLLFGFALSLFAFPFLFGWVFQGRSQMAPIAMLQVASRAAFLTATIILVRSPCDLFLTPWAEVLAVAIAAAGYVLVMRSFGYPVKISLPNSSDFSLLRQSLPVCGSQLLWAGRMYLPILILAPHFNRISIGRFGAALRIVMGAQTLLAAYFATLFPTLSEMSAESRGELAALLNGSLRDLMWPLAAVATATSFGAPIIIRLAFGVRFAEREAIHTLAVLIWILPILAWRRHYSETLIALRHSGEELVCSLLGLVLLALLTISLSRVGVSGGAWAMLIAESSALALTSWRLRRHLGSRDREQISSLHLNGR
jgi:O-antigen/teichoic acid export membrane protein